VLPLLFMMLLGVFWFGQAYSIYGALTQAARQGARAAVAPVCTTCAAGATPAQNAYNAIQNSLAASNMDAATLAPTSSWTPPALISCGPGSGSVSCDASPTNVCIQEQVRLSSPSSGTRICGISVSLRYPYKFWLPGTSLNKRQILVRAQAQMRMETQ
jgi:Flp pilus assembly protein TadG